MKQTKLYIILAFLVTAAGLSSCKKSSFGDSPDQVSLYQIIKDDYQFSMFRYVIDRAGLAADLQSGDITVIAPTNAAFNEMGFGANTNVNLEKLSVAEITAFAKNHIISGKFDLTSVTGTKTVQTTGKAVSITRKGDDYYIDGGDVTHMAVPATNGSMYVVNRVIIPVPNSGFGSNILDYLKTRTDFTFLLAAAARSTVITNILNGTSANTVFIPNNTAFTRGGYAAIANVTAAPLVDLENLMTRHVFTGTRLTASFDSVAVANNLGSTYYFDRDKTLITAGIVNTQNSVNGVPFNGRGSSSNIQYPNGAVHHIISQFIPVPATGNPTTLARIQSDASLKIFAAALDEASKKAGSTFDFLALLSGARPYTVYAPTDAAFIAAGYANEAAIRAESIDKLTTMLKYHIVSRRRATYTIGDASIPTILAANNTSNVLTTRTIAVTTATAYTVLGSGNNGLSASVSTADVVTSNGVLNIISRVLVPQLP